MSEPFVHPTAIIDRDVSLASGVKVWHFVHVSEGASIGAETSLGQNVFVGRNVAIGARVKVQNNVSVYEGVTVEDDAFLGPSCVFTNVASPRAFIVQKHAFRATRVGRGASIGANATIVCGHAIGEYAFVAAGATVTKDVPAHALVMGTPARRTAWVCRCGEKLADALGEVRCAACGQRFVIGADACTLHDAGDAPIPLLDLAAQHAPLTSALRAAFDRVLASGHFILGPEVDQLERELCSTLGFTHAITVSSGTDAILLALMALDIGHGDEVITTPFSFFATAGCIVRLGAKPVFVDIDPETFNLDPARVEAAITKRTKAIMPVHLFGQPADLGALRAIAAGHRLAIIEDAAQALGATHDGLPVGTFGAFGCFSFFPSKNLGGFGDGGLVTTGSDELAEKARVLRAHGAKPKYHHRLIGGNFRLDALQAALLRVKLPKLADYTTARRAHAAFYDAQLHGLDARGLLTPVRRSQGHVYNQYVLRTRHRDALQRALSDAGIGTEVYYPRCLHLQECFTALGLRVGDLPSAEAASREVLAIPVYPELSAAQRARIVQVIAQFFQDPARTSHA